MKKFVTIFFLCFLSASLMTVYARKVDLIFDTDLGPDYDDVGAMTILHHLADRGEVNILAIMSSNHDEQVIPSIDVLNTFFGRPNIPLGAPKSKGGVSLTDSHKANWPLYLSDNYPHKIAKTSDAEDAVKLYRRILSSRADHSVVICTVGFFTNLRDLLQSEPDEFSSMNGRELVALKVKELVSMAAVFPKGREFNVYCDTPASVCVMKEWPTRIIFSGFEIGDKVLTGKRFVAEGNRDNPARKVYEMCITETDHSGRMSWDLTATLVAVKGYKPYFNIERGVVTVSDKDGSDVWTPDAKGNHYRLTWKKTPAQIADILENYMLK